MGLLVVVLTGVVAGLETFRQVTTMGRDAATERQLARAIRTRLLTDLRSVRFAPPVAAPDDTPADDSADDAAEAILASTRSDAAAESEEDAELIAVPQVGLVGDAESLTLYVALPPRDADGSARTGDLRTVSWFLAGRGGAVAAAVAERDGPGLVRSEGDTAALAAAEAINDLPTLLAAANSLAPEVTDVAFRYFDGAEWVGSWDSSLNGALPRAVEATVQLDLDGPPSAYAAAGTEENRGPIVVRLLVCPPLSEPSTEATL